MLLVTLGEFVLLAGLVIEAPWKQARRLCLAPVVICEGDGVHPARDREEQPLVEREGIASGPAGSRASACGKRSIGRV